MSPRKKDCENWKRREILFGDLILDWQPISAATLSDNFNEFGRRFDRLDLHVTCWRDGSTVTNNTKFVFRYGSTVTNNTEFVFRCGSTVTNDAKFVFPDGSTVTDNPKFVLPHGSTVTKNEFDVLAGG